MNPEELETVSLALVIELRGLLENALNSIGGKTTHGETTYLIWCACHMNKIVAGYAELRKQSQNYASKMLIRPLIESAAALVATFKTPGFLMRKAQSEYEEERKLLREFRMVLQLQKQPTGIVDQQLAGLEQGWQRFEQEWRKSHPSDPQPTGNLRFPEILRSAGLDPWYSQYRLYCQLTHGSARAASGDLDQMTDQADNLIVVWVLLIILDQLKKHAPITLPDLAPLWHKAELLLSSSN